MALVALSLCDGIQAASLMTAPSLAQRQYLNRVSCTSVRIMGFTDPDCSISRANPITATIGDTAGLMEPLNWISNRTNYAPIQSIRYLGPISENATAFCDPIQFLFYNSQGQHVAAAYITPGQQSYGCIDFHNVTVEEYNGVRMLAGLPEGLVEVRK